MDMPDTLFLVNIAWLLTHELDAIHQHEWRIFPLTAPLPDGLAYQVFVVAHIPLVVAIIGLAPHMEFQIGFDLFLMLHAGLHWLYRHHPHYEFNGWLSQVLIWGGVPLGGLHLALYHL